MRLRWFLTRVALPVIALVYGLVGAGLSYDWEARAQKNPDLSSFYELVGHYIGPVFVSLLVLYALLFVLDLFINPSIRQLQKKLDLVGGSVRSVFDGLMTDLCLKLSVKPPDQTRASIYVQDREGSFVLSGRYSPNPLLMRPGRPSYPENEGCIGKGWEHGWHFENDLGSQQTYENRTFQRYRMAASVVRKLAMKSHLFGVKRIDLNNDFIAIVVVESMRPDRFDEASLKAEMEKFEADFAPMIATLVDYVPLPSEAKKLGFG